MIDAKKKRQEMIVRYVVNSEHVRGEKRLYWIENTVTGATSVGTWDKRKAERECAKLNMPPTAKRGRKP